MALTSITSCDFKSHMFTLINKVKSGGLTLWESCKTWAYFLSPDYLRRVQAQAANVSREHIDKLVHVGETYFPRFGKTHWRTIAELLSDFRETYPFAIRFAPLPDQLAGVFVPHPKGALESKQALILLNENTTHEMHLSTIAHENGHLLQYLTRDLIGEPSELRPIYARAHELTECLTDPEELLADFMGAIGTYPRASFQKIFCNAQGKVRWPYHFSLPLMIRAGFYLLKYYPELVHHFWRAEKKLYHLCLTIHFIRLRVFLYETYEV